MIYSVLGSTSHIRDIPIPGRTSRIRDFVYLVEAVVADGLGGLDAVPRALGILAAVERAFALEALMGVRRLRLHDIPAGALRCARPGLQFLFTDEVVGKQK